ncbi:DNA starvation/stationary phase protection protein Dps [Sulfitobacter sp. HNIBRBA2951]|uniref:DNA starvation/stationary phase protection protein Dps n=1 Tax=Sulfitobacter aquimarinus TaxID=3158557 RepID=UPI0032DFF26E
MNEVFASGIDDQARHKVVGLLNARLADMISLTLAVKQAHWTLKGPGFIGVHELLDDVAERLREGADLMAERTVVLGGQAKGTVEEVSGKTSVAPYPTDLVDIEGHVAALTERYKSVGAALREAIATTADAGDAVTEDLFTEVSSIIDKDAWFIGANAKV